MSTFRDFLGTRPSSALDRALKLQGSRVQLRKDNEEAITDRELRVKEGCRNIGDR